MVHSSPSLFHLFWSGANGIGADDRDVRARILLAWKCVLILVGDNATRPRVTFRFVGVTTSLVWIGVESISMILTSR